LAIQPNPVLLILRQSETPPHHPLDVVGSRALSSTYLLLNACLVIVLVWPFVFKIINNGSCQVKGASAFEAKWNGLRRGAAVIAFNAPAQTHTHTAAFKLLCSVRALSLLTHTQTHPHYHHHQHKHFRDTITITIIITIIIITIRIIMLIVSGFVNALFCVCLFIVYLHLVALNFHSLPGLSTILLSFFLSPNC